MTHKTRLITTLLLALSQVPVRAEETALHYPTAPRGGVVDTYHGTRVADPYRWLEDADAPATRAWVQAQSQLSARWLESIPARTVLRERLTTLWNHERYGVPARHGSHYFYTHNNGLQAQSQLLVADALQAPPRVLLDPNLLSKDGTIALSGQSVSKDGRYMAYGLATAGSDWNEWHVRDVATGQDTPDVLRWVKFSSASWTHDSKGFFYSRYDEPKGQQTLSAVNYFQKLYYHRLGTPQAKDVLIYERPDQKEWGFAGEVSDDGRYLIIEISHGTERSNQIRLLDISQGVQPGPHHTWALVDRFYAMFDYLGSRGDTLLFRTDLGAPRGCVIAVSPTLPDVHLAERILPQSSDTLEAVRRVGKHLIATYLHDAHSLVRIYDLKGHLQHTVPLPGLGTVAGFPGEPEREETFFSYTSFTTPASIYRLDAASGEVKAFKKPRVAFDPLAYETRQVFATSKDGTRVPMFVTHRNGLKLDGTNPTLLYGYGGFDISLTPSFSVANLVWMEMGGVYCVVNLRGGGEYGREWHEAGTKQRKQNVFDDCVAAAQLLIKQGYTRPERLALSGRSNGGLLVGAVITQHPELFGAALPGVGVLDMLRFQKFTIGWAWTSDYGCADNAQDFPALLAYSPVHNVRPGKHYPATLIVTADHDDRVVPAHSFKFCAALQNAQAGGAPILMRVETRAGHGAGKPVQKVIDEVGDQWAFLTAALHMKLPEGFGKP